MKKKVRGLLCVVIEAKRGGYPLLGSVGDVPGYLFGLLSDKPSSFMYIIHVFYLNKILTVLIITFSLKFFGDTNCEIYNSVIFCCCFG